MEGKSQHLIGKTLGNYSLESILGQGGMGIVYLARQIRPSRYVAVKILLSIIAPEQQMNKEFLVRFRQESDIIARLDHINIMPIYEYGEQDGLAYLVMPRLPGGSLRDVLSQKGALSLQVAATYLEQAASALDYAHAHGVIHRDLKPGNFLLHSDGRLVLADFGIARLVQESDSTIRAALTRTGMLLGTPEYMAPEMILGEQIDTRVDIYALGVVLFHMLSGRVPFQGNTPFAIANKQLQETSPLLHELNTNIPTTVDAVVTKALAKRRENRYASAGAMAQDFRSAISASHFISDSAILNAPTVLSPIKSNTPLPATSGNDIHSPSPSASGASHLQSDSTQTTVSSSNSIKGQFSPYELTTPITSYPLTRTHKRQPPYLIFIGIMLMLLLIVGGVLVGLQLNKGSAGTNPVNQSNSSTLIAKSPVSTTATVLTQLTPTSQSTQITGVPKGTLLYTVATPGRPCDSSGGHWAIYNGPIITCQGSGTLINNPHPQSPNLAGTLLTAMPNGSFPSNYVIEAQFQSLGTAADFGIYFRNQPGNQSGVYTFFIHSNGTWSAYVYDNVTAIPTEIARGQSAGFSGSGTIDVVVSGPNFSFYVNGHQVGSANDSTYSSGTVGIAVDAGGTILIGNFSLYTLANP